VTLDTARARLEAAQASLDKYQLQVRRHGWLHAPASVRAHVQRLQVRLGKRAADYRQELARERAKAAAEQEATPC
jgi:hypothetical protein